MIGYIILAASAPILFESFIQLYEHNVRHFLYKAAEEDSKKYGKPLLVIGRPKYLWKHGCGDICLDIEGCVECIYKGAWMEISMIADVRELSKELEQKNYVTFVSHVLEHLSLEDCIKALNEIRKVSVKSYILYPSKYSIIGRIHPEHKIETLEYLWSINPKGYFVIE